MNKIQITRCTEVKDTNNSAKKSKRSTPPNKQISLQKTTEYLSPITIQNRSQASS